MKIDRQWWLGVDACDRERKLRWYIWYEQIWDIAKASVKHFHYFCCMQFR